MPRRLLLGGTALAAVALAVWLGARAVGSIDASWADRAEVAPLDSWSPDAGLRATFDSLPGDAGMTARLRLLDRNPDAWVARWQMLRAAERRIDTASFIVRDDVYGLAFLGHLLHKARSGVHVRLLVDAYGTKMARSMFEEDYLGELVAAGVEVRVYRPVRARIAQSVARLDPIAIIASEHDKLLLVDGRWSLLGGRNVGHEYFADPAREPLAFLDVDVLAAGETTYRALEHAFETEWASEAAYPIPDESVDLASRERLLLAAYRAMDAWLAGTELAPDDEAARDALDVLPREHPELAGRLHDELLPADGPVHEVRVLDSVPRRLDGADAVSRGLARLVHAARCDILIQSPYLVLSRPAVELLASAGRRGVGVTVVTNGPTSSDNALSQAFFLEQWPELLARVPGMRLFVRGDRHNVHGKMAVFDGQVTVVATYNLDPVSMAVDGEVALVVWSQSFARLAAESIEGLLGDGPPISYRYQIARDESGGALRDADGRPHVVFGPEQQGAAAPGVKLRAWSLVLRAVRAVAPSNPLFWTEVPPALPEDAPRTAEAGLHTCRRETL